MTGRRQAVDQPDAMRLPCVDQVAGIKELVSPCWTHKPWKPENAAAAGLEVNAGEFVWRETGSRHVAWTPEGGLMLAMFQIPNKFYERDGRVTDVTGQDWEAVWGRALKG